MSNNPEEPSVAYEKRPIWHNPPWITAIVGLIGTFLTVPQHVGDYLHQKQEIKILETQNQGERQTQELGLIKEILKQKGTERIFLLRYISATADDPDAKIWATEEVSRFGEAGVTLKQELGIVESAYIFNAQFDSGSAALTPQTREELDTIVEQWKGGTVERVLVTGHTSNVPLRQSTKFPSNFHLSEARAVAVADYLSLKLGLDPAKIAWEGRGDTEPLASNSTREGRNRNNRVELSISGLR